MCGYFISMILISQLIAGLKHQSSENIQTIAAGPMECMQIKVFFLCQTNTFQMLENLISCRNSYHIFEKFLEFCQKYLKLNFAAANRMNAL